MLTLRRLYRKRVKWSKPSRLTCLESSAASWKLWWPRKQFKSSLLPLVVTLLALRRLYSSSVNRLRHATPLTARRYFSKLFRKLMSRPRSRFRMSPEWLNLWAEVCKSVTMLLTKRVWSRQGKSTSTNPPQRTWTISLIEVLPWNRPLSYRAARKTTLTTTLLQRATVKWPLWRRVKWKDASVSTIKAWAPAELASLLLKPAIWLKDSASDDNIVHLYSKKKTNFSAIYLFSIT